MLGLGPGWSWYEGLALHNLEVQVLGPLRRDLEKLGLKGANPGLDEVWVREDKCMARHTGFG